MKKNIGFTLFEIMLVVALVAVIGASGAPYIMRALYNINKNVSTDTEYARLYDASVAIANSIYFNGIKSITVDDNKLVVDTKFHDGSKLQINGTEIIPNLVNYAIKNLYSRGYKVELTIKTNEGEKIFFRFYAKGI